MRSCFQQNFSGLLWVLSLLPLPLSPSLPLTAGGPVIPHAANGGRKRRGGDVSAVLRRQRKRRRTCTWTISTPTSGTSARSVAHPTPAHPAPLRSPLVSVWVVGSQAGQLECAERECGFRVVPWPIHRIQPLPVPNWLCCSASQSGLQGLAVNWGFYLCTLKKDATLLRTPQKLVLTYMPSLELFFSLTPFRRHLVLTVGNGSGEWLSCPWACMGVWTFAFPLCPCQANCLWRQRRRCWRQRTGIWRQRACPSPPIYWRQRAGSCHSLEPSLFDSHVTR
jgi:hypothetical protein